MLRHAILPCLTAALILAAPPARAEIPVGADSRSALDLTLYGSGSSLVRDQRRLVLGAVPERFRFQDIARTIDRTSVTLAADGPMVVLDQAAELETLSPATLLRRSVGDEVTLVTVNPATGEETRRPARVLSADGGGVFATAAGIETGAAGRIVYAAVPPGLRARPSVSAGLAGAPGQTGERRVDLTYMAGGLNWSADYVGNLNAAGDRLVLRGRATLGNTSGADFDDAGVTLVAGQVNQAAPPPLARPKALAMRAMAAPESAADVPAAQAAGHVYVYRLPRPVDLAHGEIRQVPLIDPVEMPVALEWLLQSGGNYHGRDPNEAILHPTVRLVLENGAGGDGGPGAPLPGGLLRVYRPGPANTPLLAGSGHIPHLPVGETTRLDLGQSFDVTARRVQTDFELTGSGRPRTFTSGHKVTLKNAKDKAVTVLVDESLPGDWTVLAESAPHQRLTANLVRWSVAVPAGGRAELTFKVRFTQ